MRTMFPAAIAGLLATVANGQSGPFQSWIDSHYPDPTRVSAQQVLHDAAQSGIAQTRDQVAAMKQALRVLRGKQRGGRPAFRALDCPPVLPLPLAGVDTLVEHEFNDAWQYADTMSGAIVAGDCTNPGDVDCWRFTTAGGFYTVSVQASGAAPIVDSILTLRNQKGDVVAFNDNNAAGFLSDLSVYLPAGTYHAEVGSYAGTNGGTYSLSVHDDGANVVPLTAGSAPGTTRAANGNVAHDVFSLAVPEGRVNLQVNSFGNDTMLTVQRSDGVVVFANDDSSVGALDAAADVDLPAGTYFVHVAELNNAAGVPFVLACTTTPLALPDVAATPVVTASLVGDESMRLQRIDLSLGQRRVDLRTSDGPSNPVADTVLALLDRDLDFLCDVDDDDPTNPLRGFYSRIDVDLPTGVYYAAVVPFPGALGDFTLTTATSVFAPTGTMAFGPAPATTTIAGFGRINTYQLDNLSQTSTRMSGDDFWFAFIGSDGELASCQDGAPSRPQAGEVPTGGGYLLVWDRYDYTGPLHASFTPALHYDGVSVKTLAKDGDLVFYLASFNIVPGPAVSFAPAVRGFLLLPNNEFLVTMDVQVANTTGVNTWWTPPSFPYLLLLQSIDLHLGTNWAPPAVATFRNLLQL